MEKTIFDEKHIIDVDDEYPNLTKNLESIETRLYLSELLNFKEFKEGYENNI